MIANNVARHKETFCVECNSKTDGGAYCDDCLPENQTEQEEAYDREHPMEYSESETVVCPKSDCLKELHNNTRKGLRQSLYNHLTAAHSNEYASKRDISLAAEALVPTGGSNLVEAAAGWDEQLDDIRKTMVAGIQEGNGRMKKEGNSGAVVPQQERMASTGCPVPGCGKVSFGSDRPHLKASLDAHLRSKHSDMDSKARLALTNKALPGVPWPRKKEKSSDTSDKKVQVLTTDVGQEKKTERVVVCSCGRELRARSPKSKLDTLVTAHLQTKRHAALTQEEKIELARKMCPEHNLFSIGGTKRKVPAPQKAAEKVIMKEKTEAARAPPAPALETQLFYFDGTNGTSVKLPIGGLKQILSDLVAEQKCKISVVQQGNMLRAVIEIPEEEI